MSKINLNDILPRGLSLEAVYTLIRIKSDILRDEEDKTDEDTVSRELISYIRNYEGKDKDYLLYQLRQLAKKNKLPDKAFMYFIDHNGFSSIFYSRELDYVLINNDNKEIIKKLLERKRPSKREFIDSFGRTTNTVRLNVKVGNYDKALKEFDRLRVFYGPNNLERLYTNPAYFKNMGEILNDELFLLLNDVKDSDFTEEEKKDFVHHVVVADSVSMISLNSLSVIESILGEEEFDKFRSFLIYSVAEEKKGIYDYSGGKLIEGFDIYNIRNANINDYKGKVYTKI